MSSTGTIAERSRTLLGLLTVHDLDNLGVSRQARRTCVRRGVLVPVFRGVYRHAAHPVTAAQRVLAAVLACGTGAAGSHVTAGRHWCLDGVRGAASDPVDVAVPRTRAPSPGPGVAVHRSRDLVDADVDRRGLIPVTTPARTLIDLAPTLTAAQLERALDDAEQRGLVWRPHLRWRLDSLSGHGRAGVAPLRALVDRTEGRPLGDSWLEQEAIRLIVAAGLPVPHCQLHLRRPDRAIARVDLSWTELRLVAEVSGHGTHATRRRRQADAERAAQLSLAGWRVVEFTYEDVTERPSYVVATITSHLTQLAA